MAGACSAPARRILILRSESILTADFLISRPHNRNGALRYNHKRKFSASNGARLKCGERSHRQCGTRNSHSRSDRNYPQSGASESHRRSIGRQLSPESWLRKERLSK